MRRIFLLLFLFIGLGNVGAQELAFSDAQVAKYINKFKDLAIAEQVRTGVPAAITLAQGLLETGCGTSPLAIEAKNHFGIKCKKDWTGETMLHDDDAMQECFRKYPSDNESYIDHSNFLKNNRRYSFLFDIPAENYKDWAVGLRRAGYATSPTYSARLITLIEKHGLQQFTDQAQVTIRKTTEILLLKEQQSVQDKTKEIELAAANKKRIKDSIAQAKAQQRELDLAAKAQAKLDKEAADAKAKLAKEAEENNSKSEKEKSITVEKATSEKVNPDKYLGLEGFYAKKGDRLLQASTERNIRYQKLLELNDLDDEELPVDMFIFTEKKYKKSPSKKSHLVLEGEDMVIIAQREAMQLRQLLALNLLKINDTPAMGQRIYLQDEVSRAPLLRGQTPRVAPAVVTAKSTENTDAAELAKQAAQQEANDNAARLAQQLFEQQQKDNATREAAEAVAKAAEDAAAAAIENNAPPEKTIVPKTDLNLEEFQRQQADLANNVDNTNAQQNTETSLPSTPIKPKSDNLPSAPINTEIKNAAQENIPVAVITKPARKTPSTYDENGVSAEVRKLKKVMDEVVYMTPPPPKPKVVDTMVKKITTPVLKPSTPAVKPVVPAVKPATPATKPNTNTVKPAVVNGKPVTAKIETPVVAKPATSVNAKPAPKTEVKPNDKKAASDKTPDVKADAKKGMPKASNKDDVKKAVPALKVAVEKAKEAKAKDAKTAAKDKANTIKATNDKKKK
jgi:Mannosyl-glycoprotein endo-beta-N-acetylglucosaminidase